MKHRTLSRSRLLVRRQTEEYAQARLMASERHLELHLRMAPDPAVVHLSARAVSSTRRQIN